jgi:pimeloyl-ACP methyl ester carboxylesterase
MLRRGGPCHSGRVEKIRSVPLGDGTEVEVRVAGSGDPVLLIQTALDATELVPLARELAVGFIAIDCRRRGYGSGGPVIGGRTIAGDAADCLAVVRAVGAVPAHIVGASYSAAVALELAAAAPEAVASLVLIEAPPLVGPHDEGFVLAAERLVEAYERGGVTAALEEYTRAMGEPSWVEERAGLDRPEVERIESDAATFFAADIPALLEWRFDASKVMPHRVLSIGGADSPPMFAAVRAQIRSVFPDSEEVVVAGGGHAVAATHSQDVAAAITDFLRRHPSP